MKRMSTSRVQYRMIKKIKKWSIIKALEKNKFDYSRMINNNLWKLKYLGENDDEW